MLSPVNFKVMARVLSHYKVSNLIIATVIKKLRNRNRCHNDKILLRSRDQTRPRLGLI